MQSSAIDAIRQAELKADALLRDASQQAERVREEAARQAVDDDGAARRAAEGIAQSMLDQARDDAARAGDLAREALQRELNALDALARERRPAAVARILRLIADR